MAGYVIDSSVTATGGVAVTPSNTVDLTRAARALYIGVSGDVKIIGLNGNDVTFVAHPVGYVQCGAKRVYASGTTALSIVALF